MASILLTYQRHKVICEKFTLSLIQNEGSEAEEACPRPVSEGFQLVVFLAIHLESKLQPVSLRIEPFLTIRDLILPQGKCLVAIVGHP